MVSEQKWTIRHDQPVGVLHNIPLQKKENVGIFETMCVRCAIIGGSRERGAKVAETLP